MTLYPAIDLRCGRCVRLEQGDPERETQFSDDPAATARGWVSEGAEWLHVVDLDGAFSGERANETAIRDIVKSAGVPVQLGGGLRTVEAIASAVDAGIERVIVGTAAHERPAIVREAAELVPGRVAVGIDARDGLVATRGWRVVTDVAAVDMARRMEDLGAAVIIYTDIGRDGMLEGPNIGATRALAESLSIPVIASGGVASLTDVEAARDLAEAGVEGVIVGRALYAGQFTLPDAIAVLRGGRA